MGREVVVVEDAGRAGGLEDVGRDRVPAAEHQVVEPRQRHELANQRIALLLARAEPDVRHLAQRADRRMEALAGSDDTGDEGRRHGPHAGREDTERAGGGSDVASRHDADNKGMFIDCHQW